MSKDVYIVSTMTDSISYNFYTEVKEKNEVPQLIEKFTIRGGRGMPSNKSGFGEQVEDLNGHPLWVADGVVTRVPADKYERLKNHWLFIKHEKAGRLRVINEDITGNHKKVRQITRSMEGADSHALLTRETLKTRVKVKTPAADDGDGHRI